MAVRQEKILRAIWRVGKNGNHFQTPDVRKVLGIETKDKSGTQSIHNVIGQLREEAVVEDLSPDKGRFKYFKIVDEEKFRARLYPTAATSGRYEPGAGAPDRLTQIEQRLDELEAKIEQRLDEVEKRVSKVGWDAEYAVDVLVGNVDADAVSREQLPPEVYKRIAEARDDFWREQVAQREEDLAKERRRGAQAART